MRMENSETPLVLYHKGCTDGFAAAWAVYSAFSEIEAIPVGYGQPPPEVTGRDVYIVDFAYPRDTLIEMHKRARSLLVIDHHETSEKDLEGLDFAIFDMKRSGAGLTWDYFFGENGVASDDAKSLFNGRPWIIDYIEDRDLWTWRLSGSRLVNAFLGHQEQTFDWWDCMHDTMSREDACEAGVVAQSIIDHYVRTAYKSAIITSVGAHMVPVINATYWHCSELLERLSATRLVDDVKDGMSIDEATAGEHEGTQAEFAMSWYVRGDGKYQYSLRSRDKPDGSMAFSVSSLARSLGGGGHHRAAGFIVNKPVHTNALIVEKK